ncbi:MAG: APC family permease [Gemmatimonadota bacterium]|nr:APC family permease [Gemmatimonadota bacterium]
MSVRGARSAGTGALLRVLGVVFGLSVIIGNSIGAGILRTPGEVASLLPTGWLFFGVWVAGGLYALLGTNALSELGTMLPRSGGQYIFARYTFGSYAGFLVGWSDWLSTCGSGAAIALVVGEYSGRLVPPLAPWRQGIALLSITIFALVQWAGVREGAATQVVTSALKTAAFAALIAACFLLGARHPLPPSAVQTSQVAPSLFAAIVLALQSVIYTYDGWSGALYFSEEVRNPERGIPRAMFGGVLALIAIYLLVNAAFVHVLPLRVMAGETLVAGTAAQAVFGGAGDRIIRWLTLLSMLSAINAILLMASRVLFAMGRDGLVGRAAVVRRVNAGGTPTFGLLVSALVAGAFILWSERFQAVIAVVSYFFVANYAVSFATVFVLRAREPGASRPFRAWGHPWTTAIALAVSVAFLGSALWVDRQHISFALFLLAASYPIFRVVTRGLARPSEAPPRQREGSNHPGPPTIQ